MIRKLKLWPMTRWRRFCYPFNWNIWWNPLKVSYFLYLLLAKRKLEKNVNTFHAMWVAYAPRCTFHSSHLIFLLRNENLWIRFLLKSCVDICVTCITHLLYRGAYKTTRHEWKVQRGAYAIHVARNVLIRKKLIWSKVLLEDWILN